MDFKFSGVNISSTDPVRTFEFYQKLGFRITEECAPDSKWYGATFALTDEADQPQIWVWRRQDGDTDCVCNLLVFDTGDKLDEVYARFRQAGVECEPPATAVWGGRELMLTDPDGNRLLFL